MPRLLLVFTALATLAFAPRLAAAQTGRAQTGRAQTRRAQPRPQHPEEPAGNAGLLHALSGEPPDVVTVRPVGSMPEALRGAPNDRLIRRLRGTVQPCVEDTMGRWTFDLVIRANGHVRSVSPVEPADPPRCLIRAMRRFQLRPRRARGEVTLRLRVVHRQSPPANVFGGEGSAVMRMRGGGGSGLRGVDPSQGGLGTGHSGPPPRSAPRPSVRMLIERPQIRGSLPLAIVQRVLRGQRSRLRYCYESELRRSPDLAGRLVLAFIVAPSGVVQSARVEPDTLDDSRLTGCLARQVRRIRFPSGGAGISVVRVPLTFSSATSP